MAWRLGCAADRRRAMASCSGPAGAVQGSGASGFAFDSGLEIKTRSVEQTLLPLVSQVTQRAARPLVSLGPRWRWRLARLGPARGQPPLPVPHRHGGDFGAGAPVWAWGPAGTGWRGRAG